MNETMPAEYAKAREYSRDIDGPTNATKGISPVDGSLDAIEKSITNAFNAVDALAERVLPLSSGLPTESIDDDQDSFGSSSVVRRLHDLNGMIKRLERRVRNINSDLEV